ncbi:HAUS augmin-like complex subunit 2 [Macrobrachium rosenbergii]|uniref:HAUS augmin-like complex subunit 2 n=1 Tax=Macrobrachium rosenbergii TaxID=79674 RepID=UPI0034D3E1FE
MDELLVAHQSLDDIITSFYPDNVGDTSDAVNIRSSFNNLNNSSQAVTDFLECFSHLTAVRGELAMVEEKFNSAQLNKLSSNLIHPAVVGEHISRCQEAEKHLRTIIENKDLLIYHLQQPFITNYLTMHYQYHRDLVTLVEDLTDILNKTEVHLQLMEDQAQDSMLQRADSGIINIVQTVTELKTTLDNIVALKNLIPGIMAQKQDDIPIK